MSIVRLNDFEAKEGQEKELAEFLNSLVAFISESAGCISCELLRHYENPTRFVMLERWKSVEHHQNSYRSYPKEKMQKAMELFAKPPTGNYFQV